MGCLMVRYLLLAVLLSGSWTDVCAAEETPIVVLLKDGRSASGRLVREDDEVLILRTENGEERGIAKVRVEKVIRGTARVPEEQPAQTGSAQAEARKKQATENRAMLQELKDLGDPSREKRRAAMARVAELGSRAEPLLVGILHPKEKMPVELRLGALRALAAMKVLSAESAKSVAWVAMKDTNVEVRREACRTIRTLSDDRAVAYIMQYSVGEDAGSQRAASWALREIDDLRAIAALVAALPTPQVSSSAPQSDVPEGTWRELPIGPYGDKLPVFMPQGETATGTADVGHPVADALKRIAGKDLGSHPMVWHYWLRQKIGTLTSADVEKGYEKRSLLDRMNAK